MSLIVKEKSGARKGNNSAPGITTYNRAYFVTSTEALTEPAALAAVDSGEDAFTIPKYNENHPDDDKAGAVSRSAGPINGDEKKWLVSIQWKTRSSSDTVDEDDIDDPTARRAVVNFGHVTYTKVADLAYQEGDTQGNPTQPVLNSAGDPPDPPFTVEYNHTVLELQYWVRRWDPSWNRIYENNTNSEAIMVVQIPLPIKNAKILSLDSKPLYDTDDDRYWEINANIEISDEVFQKQMLDMGFNYLNEGEKTEITVKDSKGKDVPVSSPQRLNGSGYLSDESVFLPFVFCWPSSWKALNLPKDF
jgi:hypothetical protein